MKLLLIPAAIRDSITYQARRELPNECCGLLAGHGDTVTHHFPLVNELASPTRFCTSAQSLFLVMKQLRELKLETLAFYHRHPASGPVPSRRDVDEANWPGVVTLIISLWNGEIAMRAWQIDGETVQPVAIKSDDGF